RASHGPAQPRPLRGGRDAHGAHARPGALRPRRLRLRAHARGLEALRDTDLRGALMEGRGDGGTGRRGEEAVPKGAEHPKRTVDEGVERQGARNEDSNATTSRHPVSPSPRPPVSPSADVERRAAGVKLLLLDCDGVLTD